MKKVRFKYSVRLHSLGKSLLMLMLTMLAFTSRAQDPIFSQFYLNKTYLNPAYAGYTRDLAVGFQSRWQWTNVPGIFQTNTAHLNYGSSSTRLGFGLQFYDNVEGEGRLHTRYGCFQMSYNLPGRFGRKWGNSMYGRKYIVSMGMQGAIGQKSIDWEKLTFTDQLDPYRGLVKLRTDLTQGADVSNIIYDLSAGIRARVETDRKGSYISFGAAMFHLNSPKETFFDFETYLVPRYTGHFFYHFQTKKFVNNPSFLSIGYVIDRQHVLQTNSIYVAKDIGRHFTLGFSFRRMLVFEFDHNNDAFIILFNFQKNDLIFGYSYDLTVSSLQVYNSYGTHEVGMIYMFRDTRPKKKKVNPTRYDDCFFLNRNGFKSSSGNSGAVIRP